MKYLKDYKRDNLWNEFNFSYENFTNKITLYDYQIQALKGTVSYLSNYYKQDGFSARLKDWFFENSTKKEEADKNKLNTNMLSYWMATGSGKTIVIVKLIEMLQSLYDDGFLETKNDILFLTEREDLIAQFKKEVHKFNSATQYEYTIITKSLKEHDAYVEKKQPKQMDTVNNNEIIVYCYKSGTLTNPEQVAKSKDGANIDYEKLLNKNIHIILDEAHKGSKSEDNKRFTKFFEITKKGFLFNFSATLTEPNQQRMSVIKFDLTKYIKEGYGKKIQVLSNNIAGYDKNKNNENNFSHLQQLEIIKSFILLCYLKKSYEKLQQSDIYKDFQYHNPMMVILTNTVNTEDADLQIIFKAIFHKLDNNLFNQAKKVIETELQNKSVTIAKKDESFDFDRHLFETITIEDIHKYVYNKSGESAHFEYTSPNEKEISFKYNNTDKNFALVKIGTAKDFAKFINNEYHIVQYKSFLKHSEFDNLEDSSVNILMGSRSFYEGWDSLRPNILMYINIGSDSANKFVLQSLGRGIRISPNGKDRKRLQYIENTTQSNQYTNALETLFVMSTNTNDINNILHAIEENKGKEEKKKSLKSIFVKNQKPNSMPLYKPVYKAITDIYKDKDNISKLPILHLCKADTTYIEDLLSRKTLAEFYLQYCYLPNFTIEKLVFIKDNIQSLVKEDDNKSEVLSKDTIFRRIFTNISSKLEELDSFIEEKEDSIVHYQDIEISESLYDNFCSEVKNFLNHKSLSKEEEFKIYKEQGLEALNLITMNAKVRREYNDGTLNLQLSRTNLHYYKPLIYAEEHNANITNIIYNKSEYNFLKLLFENIDSNNLNTENLFFSRIQEKKDNIYIPYVEHGKLQRFYPDFIFWKQKENNKYSILFVDPKGLSYSSYQFKIDGFKKYLANRVSDVNSDINVDLALYNNSIETKSEGYEEYIYDNDKIINKLKTF